MSMEDRGYEQYRGFRTHTARITVRFVPVSVAGTVFAEFGCRCGKTWNPVEFTPYRTLYMKRI